ncbi:hypothetical protein [uncultured Alistipes sp.]|uniref:hypothetical protein n=1 Tax=uncultured Alistipes sp. TaxID=538949 RepID=UPI002631895C|nr:hypothetical protein [uncultured Alistipes sp.]
MNLKNKCLLSLAALATLGGSVQLRAQEKLEPTGEMPILAWHGIPAEETTVERFRELKEAGFTHNFSFYGTAEQVAKALDVARKVGIKQIITCAELRSEPEKTVARFKNHPALAGYFLRDEPLCSDFAALGEWAKRIRAADDDHFCYLNLFPTGPQEHFDALGAKDYRDYVSRFDKEVPLQFLSFDHYPVTYDGLKAEWYENLEEFADEARKAGKDFWAFALATAHGPYPVPTMAMLRLQMYSNLAYGAQGLQYFTYWTPAGDSHWDFQFGPIGLDGKRTEAYDRVKAMNEELRNLSGVFLGAKVNWVRHTGPKIPRKTVRLTALPEPVKVLETEGTGAVVSQLENGGRTFLVIVNRDYLKSMKLTFYAGPSVKRILKDGSIVPSDAYKGVMEVDPGDAVIYMW